MPKYGYKCPACKKEIEIFHRIGEVPEGCPDCGAKLDRVFTPFQIMEKREETDIEKLVTSNKKKFHRIKENIKGRTYEDLKNE